MRLKAFNEYKSDKHLDFSAGRPLLEHIFLILRLPLLQPAMSSAGRITEQRGYVRQIFATRVKRRF